MGGIFSALKHGHSPRRICFGLLPPPPTEVLPAGSAGLGGPPGESTPQAGEKRPKRKGPPKGEVGGKASYTMYIRYMGPFFPQRGSLWHIFNPYLLIGGWVIKPFQRQIPPFIFIRSFPITLRGKKKTI